MPLPPYIGAKRDAEERDKVDYQTVYAAEDGAVAAPTAGLHFTERLLQQLADTRRHHRAGDAACRGRDLPAGEGRRHRRPRHARRMGRDRPRRRSSASTRPRRKGGRVVAVGTTSLRLLETAARATGTLQPFIGDTDIFITPGFRFRAVDVLMTNFHLPSSTLFMLVSAFAGLDTMQAAYAHAIADGYRFYSYGDASLLFRQPQDGETDDDDLSDD